MNFRLIVSSVLVLSSVSMVAHARVPMSSHRGALEPYKVALDRAYERVESLSGFENQRVGETVYDVRVSSFEDLNVSLAPQLQSYEELRMAFERFRDLRYLQDPEVPSFLRRITWLYPDDGCFIRAELLSRLLEGSDMVKPAKLFVFGNLRAPTKNHPNGFVSWWYHVGAAYRVNQELYVLDPSVESTKPLKDDEWAKLVGDRGEGRTTTLQWSLCSARAIDPAYDCKAPEEHPESDVKTWLEPYLDLERSRVTELGHEPELYLGDFPPWNSFKP